MSQQLHNTEDGEDDKGQEQSCPAPPQQIPAATAMSATRMPVPAAPATGSADTEMPASMDNTTTSSSMRVQSQKQNLYHSVPLLRGQIRLLQLLPHEDEAAAIHCRLFRTTLDSRGTRLYEALSYVWGSGDKPRSIFVNGRELAVGGNLYAALLHLRDPSIERTIWIDAICINQEDPEEKRQQVQSMAKIYAQATRVIVWLGEEAAGSSQALEEIRTAAGNDQPLEDIQTAAEPSTGQSDDKVEILALLQRPWFQRIWVLQEVAAARHILIKCGSAEVDGYAFCLGLNALNLFDELRADLRARILSVAYLIRGAIFRPNYATTCQTDNFSLDIRPLGELIEMYHTREATDRRDKVYALLGMSSDNPIAAGLSADYTISWKQLFNKLIQFSLSQLVSVGLWDDKEIAVIEGKGCIIGEVSWVEQNATWKDRQDVTIIWRRAPIAYEFRCILPTTPKSIRWGDVVCLLQGASRPTILRPCNDHWAVIMIAVSPAHDVKSKATFFSRHGNIKWSQLLQSVTVFPHDFLLIWDWDLDPDRQQDQENYDYLASVPVTGHPVTGLEGCLDAATRIRTVRLALQEGRQHEAAVEHVRKEMTALDRVLRNMNTLKKDCLGSDDSGQEDAKKLETMVNQLMEEKGPWELLKLAVKNGHEMFVNLLLDTDKVNLDSEELNEALCQAAENGHKAIVEMLLGTGQVDANYYQGFWKQTALHLAAEKGHEAVVKLLLDSGKIDVNLKTDEGATALHHAAQFGKEAVVKLLLDSGKVNPNHQDKRGRTVLHSAFQHEAIVKLLLDTGKVDVNLKNDWGGTLLHLAALTGERTSLKLLLDTGKVDANEQDNSGQTALHLAAKDGHEAVVKLLLDSGKVDTNKQDKDGRTALHLAAYWRQEAAVKLLLDTGKVDVYIQDEDGDTALDRTASRAISRLLSYSALHTKRQA